MPAKKFRFVSPGVQIKEIDRSQLPALPDAIGPVVIGRTLRGPGMVPVTVNSYEEFVEKFGAPDRGVGSSDVWRKGSSTSPVYASYAAEAYLRNSSPLTVVRLLGTQHKNADAASDGSEAGWSTNKAMGLFIMESSASAGGATDLQATLAAVFYVPNTASVKLKGKNTNNVDDVHEHGTAVQSIGSQYEFTAVLGSETSSFNFDKSSSRYIRRVFNTNPTLTNASIIATTSSLFLGETFETNL